jgi:arsenate reductase (thioredoxin)
MKLLFLCTHNACRSVLAESIARHIGGELWRVTSAGSHPAGSVHPDTLTVLAEKRLPLDGLHSKSWDDVQEFHPDIVITVCDQAAGESCPVWFGSATKAHWGLPDPTKEADTDRKRQLFDQVISTLEARLQHLANFLKQEPSATTEQFHVKLKQLEELK